jgi:hypothetical protein
MNIISGSGKVWTNEKAEVETPAFQTHYPKMYHYETNPEMMPEETVGASSFSPPVKVS